MDKSDCECDDAYFEQTMAAQNCDPIKTHRAGHHLVQTCPLNHAGESNSLIQNHQAAIVSNEHMMLAPTLSADDLINAVNRHRYTFTDIHSNNKINVLYTSIKIHLFVSLKFQHLGD